MTHGTTAATLRMAVFFFLVHSHCAHAWDSVLDLDVGYRTDKLDWNIASNASGTSTPNILSELSWDDLRIRQLGASWRLTRADGVQLHAHIDYGWIVDGRNRDSDYLGNNRTQEFSRSDNDTNGDYVWDLALAGGMRVPITDVFAFIPSVGVSHHAQLLRITDGNQTIPPSGPFPGLDSTYRTQWTGPFIGAEINAAIGARVQAFVRMEHHWANYYAKANWNLRSDFQHPRSFEHEADGTGRLLAVGLSSGPLWSGWRARLTYQYQKWRTDPGIDRVFFDDGSVAITRLNEVNWTSRALLLGLERPF